MDFKNTPEYKADLEATRRRMWAMYHCNGLDELIETFAEALAFQQHVVRTYKEIASPNNTQTSTTP